MVASPGCWAAFTELIAREFGDQAYGALHRHAVDAYAVQHPGTDDRRARQSVAVHLIGLCHWLEHGMPADALTRITQALTTEPREWPWLDAADVVQAHGDRRARREGRRGAPAPGSGVGRIGLGGVVGAPPAGPALGSRVVTVTPVTGRIGHMFDSTVERIR